MDSKDILDSEFTERGSNENRLFSISFIQKINLIEIAFFIFIAIERIRLIYALKSLGSRGLINIISYETGWTFIIIIGLIISNISLIRSKINSYHWLIKFSGYLCLLHLIGVDFEFYGFVILFMICYYSLNGVSKKFNVTSYKKLTYIVIAIMVSILFFYLNLQFPILNY